MSLYKIRNRFTDTWMIWDSLEQGAKSIAAPQKSLIGLSMMAYEREDFQEMIARDLEETISASGMNEYTIVRGGTQ